MKTIKTLMIAILLSGFFIPSQALAKVCDEKHPLYPAAKFHSVRIYTAAVLGTSCHYGEKGQYELLAEETRPNIGPWKNIGYFLWVCGKPYTPGTRETCVFS